MWVLKDAAIWIYIGSGFFFVIFPLFFRRFDSHYMRTLCCYFLLIAICFGSCFVVNKFVETSNTINFLFLLFTLAAFFFTYFALPTSKYFVSSRFSEKVRNKQALINYRDLRKDVHTDLNLSK